MFGTSTVASGLSLSKIVGGISKTLGIVNQVIPIYQQAKPIISNAKNMFAIYKEFKSTPNNKNTIKNKNPEKKAITSSFASNNPIFFQ